MRGEVPEHAPPIGTPLCAVARGIPPRALVASLQDHGAGVAGAAAGDCHGARCGVPGAAEVELLAGEVSHPALTGQVSEAARASDPAVAALGASQGGLGVTSAWIALGDLSLVGCANGSAPEILAQGPNVENLLSPAPTRSHVSGASFCELDVPLVAAGQPLPGGAPPELSGATLVVGGKRADGVPFVVVSQVAHALALTTPHGFAVDDGAHSLLVVVDISALFSGVDLSSAVLDQGTARVTSTANAALLSAFNANVPQAIALYYDDNHNGQFDPGEPGPIATAP